MLTNTNAINWEKTINLFNTIKWLYSLCEETDPELCTNLQPLNEFRASLDHLMRIIAIEHIEEFSNADAEQEYNKLHSHLRRAFFDICDLLSINYRNKIIDTLKPYDVDCIQVALPTYYSEIRPRLEQITEDIAELRTGKRVNDGELAVDEYANIVKELKDYYKTIYASVPSLNDIRRRTRSKNIILQWIIPIVTFVVGTTLGILGLNCN